MQYHRRSIRLPEYDYSQFGYYYVTICVQDRELYLEKNNIKQIIDAQWQELKNKFNNIDLDEYVIMPNHLHGIIVVNENNCRGLIYQTQNYQINNQNQLGRDKSRPYNNIKNNPMSISDITLGKIIRYFKAKTAYKIRKSFGDDFIKFGYFAWQRNYYEHIIRNNQGLNRIRNYIINNPDNWETDRNNPKNFKKII